MKKINNIGIAGAGIMGASMAETFAKFGYNVFVYDLFPEALEKAKNLIALNHQTEVSENILTKERSLEIQSHIQYTSNLQDFASMDLVVEAIVERLEIKHQFWAQLSAIVSKECLLATNTSGLSITKIAQVVEEPQRFAGMHWINPPHIIPLIEVIQGEKTADETVDAIYQICLDVNKKPVKIRDAPGFALNRIQFAIMREALHIVKEGIASPEDVDKVMKYALGIRYAAFGPLEVADFGGLDTFYNISSYLFRDLGDEKEVFGLLKEAYDQGHYGVKSGKGFYDYSDGKDKEAIVYRDQMYTKIAKTLFNEKE